jgi:tetratricopeptide (TPR) repeat protein
MREFFLGYRPSLLIGWWKLWRSIPVVDWIRAAELFRAGEFKRAAFYYDRGIQLNPKNPAIYCAKLDHAYCVYQLGEPAKAKTLLEELTAAAPLKDAHLILAKIQLALGKNADAVSTMKRCLSFCSDDLQVALCYAHVMFESDSPAITMKLVKDFINTFREKLSIDDPMHVAVDTALATYECYFGDEELGERLLSRALASGVAPFEAIMLRGERWLEQGRVTQAREQLDRAAKGCPTDPRPYLRLAESYLLNGELLEPKYSVQLATVACRLSNWENKECLEVLRQGYLALQDVDMVELIESRLRTLAPLEVKAPEFGGERTKTDKYELM